MCFSATASLTAGTLLSMAGAACMAQAPDRRSLPFAAIPALFGLQQLAEGGLWLALSEGDAHLQSCFTVGFSLIAQVLWPIYVPLAVWLIEPPGWRRSAMALCGALGTGVGLSLLYGQIRLPIAAEMAADHIFYRSPHFDALYNAGLFVPALLLYLAATCLSLMLSRERIVNAIGAAMAGAFALTYLFYETWLISVWCFFAAALSGLVWLWAQQRREQTVLIPRVQTS